RRVSINNLVAYNADSHFSSIIAGIPGNDIEDVKLSNIRMYYRPIDSPKVQIQSAVPEFSKDYPEPQRFGVMPSYGIFIRHVRNIEMNNVEISFMGEETRPAVMLEDVKGITFNNFKAQTPAGIPAIVH